MMQMTPLQVIITILAVAFVTYLTRALPFAVFSEKRPVPGVIQYLGRVLPPAMAGVLIVYALRNASFLPQSFAWRELCSLIVLLGIYMLKKSTILSIFGGTAVYMLLVWAF